MKTIVERSASKDINYIITELNKKENKKEWSFYLEKLSENKGELDEAKL